MEALDSIYIPRGGTQDSRDHALELIKTRQELIEDTGKYAPFLVFPEGGTTNGTGLLKFKRGAFYAEKTVRPICLKYHYQTISPAFDVIEFIPLALLQLSWACLSCDVVVFPDFQPNEYLFEKH